MARDLEFEAEIKNAVAEANLRMPTAFEIVDGFLATFKEAGMSYAGREAVADLAGKHTRRIMDDNDKAEQQEGKEVGMVNNAQLGDII